MLGKHVKANSNSARQPAVGLGMFVQASCYLVLVIQSTFNQITSSSSGIPPVNCLLHGHYLYREITIDRPA
ncbi:hypothetical protein BJY04DRAFT_183102 [Aspergillus karnatakaensis]|uniref:uncharacterized protein n=1 Tax=Aspergillus karnatakaensis TaxID=1810916 RepID=UPI003CCD5C89